MVEVKLEMREYRWKVGWAIGAWSRELLKERY